VCWKCGASLAEFPLPLSRLAECPKCRAYQHACKLCVHFAPGRPKACNEQDAEEVTDKEHANFCGWFEPRDHAFRGGPGAAKAGAAKAALDSLFGDDGDGASLKNETSRSELDKLFGRKPG